MGLFSRRKKTKKDENGRPLAFQATNTTATGSNVNSGVAISQNSQDRLQSVGEFSGLGDFGLQIGKGYGGGAATLQGVLAPELEPTSVSEPAPDTTKETTNVSASNPVVGQSTPTITRATLTALPSSKVNSRRNSNDTAADGLRGLRSSIGSSDNNSENKLKKVTIDLTQPGPSTIPTDREPAALAISSYSKASSESSTDKVKDQETSTSTSFPVPISSPKSSESLNKSSESTPTNGMSSNFPQHETYFKPLQNRCESPRLGLSHPFQPMPATPIYTPPDNVPNYSRPNALFYDKDRRAYFELKPLTPDSTPTPSPQNSYRLLPLLKGEQLNNVLEAYGLNRVVVHPRFVFCFLAVALYYIIGIQGLIISFILTLVVLEIKIETIRSNQPGQLLTLPEKDSTFEEFRAKPASFPDPHSIQGQPLNAVPSISRLPSPVQDIPRNVEQRNTFGYP